MSTSNKRAATALLTFLAPLVALAGVVGAENGNPGAPGRPGAGGYTLRCWQEGRLILEEQYVSLPPIVDAATTRLQVIDRHQQPVIVAETRNATCLVKAQPSGRPRGTLP
jgi:hypothetical protein